MEHNLLALDSNRTISEAADWLKATSVSSVPIIKPTGEFSGVVSTKELLAAYAGGKDPKGTFLWEISGLASNVIAADASVRDAAAMMVENNQHRLYVTENDQIVGVVSSFEIIKEFIKIGAAEIVA